MQKSALKLLHLPEDAAAATSSTSPIDLHLAALRRAVSMELHRRGREIDQGRLQLAELQRLVASVHQQSRQLAERLQNVAAQAAQQAAQPAMAAQQQAPASSTAENSASQDDITKVDTLPPVHQVFQPSPTGPYPSTAGREAPAAGGQSRPDRSTSVITAPRAQPLSVTSPGQVPVGRAPTPARRMDLGGDTAVTGVPFQGSPAANAGPTSTIRTPEQTMRDRFAPIAVGPVGPGPGLSVDNVSGWDEPIRLGSIAPWYQRPVFVTVLIAAAIGLFLLLRGPGQEFLETLRAALMAIK